MHIQNEVHDKTGRFFIEENNETVAEIDYQLENGSILIVHTEVNDSLEGKGVGKQLVAEAVNYARENSLSVKTTCPFASVVLKRNKEYSDVYNSEKK